MSDRKFEWYFKIRRWEKSGLIYRVFGIEIFRNFVLWNWNRYLRRQGKSHEYKPTLDSNYFIKDFSLIALRSFIEKTKINETIHLLGQAVVLLSLISLILSNFNIISMISSVLAIFTGAVNLYCIMLQRYNRSKVERLYHKRLNRKRNDR